MFNLFFERRHRVLMAEVSGVFSSHDMAELDAAVIRFLSHDGDESTVRAIYDFSAVEAFAVPESRIAERGLRPPIVRGRRVMVAPSDSGESFAVTFRDHQRSVANNEPLIVASRAAAYTALGLDESYFEPVIEES